MAATQGPHIEDTVENFCPGCYWAGRDPWHLPPKHWHYWPEARRQRLRVVEGGKTAPLLKERRS